MVNSIAPLLVTQALLPQVEKSEDKVIVNVSSMMGSISLNTTGGNYLYGSSKAALNFVTKSMTVDLNSKGIRVVSVHPGWVRTDMVGEQASLLPTQSVEGIRNI